MTLPSPWQSVPQSTPHESGQAHVYRVSLTRHPGLSHYALKRLKSTHPVRAKRFQREIEITNHLHGIGLSVPEIVESGDHEGRPYFVMPWFDDGTLEDQLPVLASDRTQGLSILLALAETMGAIHAAEFAHRDLKPSNLLMDGGVPHVADFGLSISESEAAEPSARLTATREQIGSRFYIAPENEYGFNESVDQRPADCYAFGKIAWVVLSGRSPLPREAQNEPSNRLATVMEDSALTPIDLLSDRLAVADPRGRLVNWEQIAAELRLALEKVRGGSESAPPDGLIGAALEAATAFGQSDTARSLADTSQAEEALRESRQRIQAALNLSAMSHQDQLKKVSDASAGSLEVSLSVGGAILGNVLPEGPPPGVDSQRRDVKASLAESAVVLVTIDTRSDRRISSIQIGAYALFQDSEVWLVSGVVATQHDAGAYWGIPALTAAMSEIQGPFEVTLGSAIDAAENMGAALVSKSIGLYSTVATCLRNQEPLDDREAWSMYLGR